MSFSERFVEFDPTVDSGDTQGGYEERLYRSAGQFLAETEIDVFADIRRIGGSIPRLCDLGDGATSELQLGDGANYWFSRLDYWQDNVWKGCRMIAEIPPGSQHEFVYWAKEAPEKQLTIHKGSGEIVLIDPADGARRVVEFEDQTAEASLPPGFFYTLRAKPESKGPFVISGFYEEVVDWSAVEIIVRPGDTIIKTPDGDLPVPPEFQYQAPPREYNSSCEHAVE